MVPHQRRSPFRNAIVRDQLGEPTEHCRRGCFTRPDRSRGRRNPSINHPAVTGIEGLRGSTERTDPKQTEFRLHTDRRGPADPGIQQHPGGWRPTASEGQCRTAGLIACGTQRAWWAACIRRHCRPTTMCGTAFGGLRMVAAGYVRVSRPSPRVDLLISRHEISKSPSVRPIAAPGNADPPRPGSPALPGLITDWQLRALLLHVARTTCRPQRRTCGWSAADNARSRRSRRSSQASRSCQCQRAPRSEIPVAVVADRLRPGWGEGVAGDQDSCWCGKFDRRLAEPAGDRDGAAGRFRRHRVTVPAERDLRVGGDDAFHRSVAGNATIGTGLVRRDERPSRKRTVSTEAGQLQSVCEQPRVRPTRLS
jgi:hypothetical protein